jgi:peptidoglycan-associated lipoprotein
MKNPSFKFVVALVAVAAVAATGCRSRKGKAAGVASDYPDDPLTFSSITDDETGLALTGEPFDFSHTPATDVAVQPVYFGYDSFQLPAEEIAKIQQAADILRQNPSYVLIVEGHCDERGSNEYNLSLGEQRALAVRNYINGLGIDSNRVQSRSFGEERPAVQGVGEEAWRLNRRGEFAFYK